MRLAFVYAGQGSQKAGMGKDFYENCPSVQAVFDNTPCDFAIKETCFDDPENLLSQTRYTQPCMVTFAVAVTDLLKTEGIVPEAVAGLSLGEYSALYAAGVFDRETVLSLVAYRGKVMEETTKGIDSKMIAVLGADYDTVKKAVDSAQDKGVVDIANLNCTGQIVIGGETAAVEAAAEQAKSLGAKRCIPLNVSGPFHTRLMEEASVLLKEKLDNAEFHDMQVPVIFNITGESLAEGMTVKEALTKQVKSSVYFEKTIQTMKAMGIDTIVEIGPGKVLAGFVKKTAPEIRVIGIDSYTEFTEAVKLLKE